MTQDEVLKGAYITGVLPSSRKLSTLFPLDPPEETISFVVRVRLRQCL
jgi:hypothetical protein